METINTNLTLAEYTAIVEALSEMAFDEFGQYQPHKMFFSAVVNFYQFCVNSPRFEIENESDINSYNKVFQSNEIMDAFAKEIKNPSKANRLTFNQAYHHAKEICDYKNKNAERALVNLVNRVAESINNINDTLNPDNIKAFANVMGIVDQYASGQVSEEEADEKLKLLN